MNPPLPSPIDPEAPEAFKAWLLEWFGKDHPRALAVVEEANEAQLRRWFPLLSASADRRRRRDGKPVRVPVG